MFCESNFCLLSSFLHSIQINWDIPIFLIKPTVKILENLWNLFEIVYSYQVIFLIEMLTIIQIKLKLNVMMRGLENFFFSFMSRIEVACS